MSYKCKSINRSAISFLIAIYWLFISGCNSTTKKSIFPDTDRYAISHPAVIVLPEVLDEISGIAYYPKDTSVFAIVDEEGTLFKIPLKNPKASSFWTFDQKRDFEDLVYKDSTFYVLVSNGDIITVRFQGNSPQSTKSDFSRESKRVFEFESLFLEGDSLNLICKNCDMDKKSGVSLFTYNPYSISYTLGGSLSTSELWSKSALEMDHLRPSAAAVNPVTGELYIVSSINKMLVIYDKAKKYKSMYPLNPKFYKQPEGIAFTPEGHMIISNEFAESGLATLLIIKNNRKE